GRPAEPDQSADVSNEPPASVDTTEAEPSGTNEMESSPGKDAQLPEQPLPAELDSTLLSIESGTLSQAHEMKPSEVPTEQEDIAQPSMSSEPVTSAPSTPSEPTTPAPVADP